MEPIPFWLSMGSEEPLPTAVMAEAVLKAALQIVVVGPVGVWRDLRARANGQSEILPIVMLGGCDGDIPLGVSVGEPLTDLVVDKELSHVRRGEEI